MDALIKQVFELKQLLKKGEQPAGEPTPEPKPEKATPQTPIPHPREPVHRTEPQPVPTETEPYKKRDIPKPAPAMANMERSEAKAAVSVAPKRGFFERNPDLEKFIGENLANKIGIAILVIGVGFFVKYAIDRDWINEIGRVFIGILCGGALLGVAHRLRNSFAAFSSVLVGGGIAVLYFTITIAFQEYQIFSQTAAFALMVVITGFTIVLALGYNRVELAVLAILGGFGSPFMVSTGEGNYIVLFTYMLILNCGMLVLAFYKKWRIVNIICYAFTVIIFGAWMVDQFDASDVSMIRGSLIFATLFYLVFFAMNIISNLKLNIKFAATEIILLLSNTFLYFTAGLAILDNTSGRDFQGLFTALLAIFNFVFAYSLYKNARVDRNLVFMLIGLVLTFISLAAPIQLEGNYITLFWAAEAVLLLWLSQKSGIRLMAVASVIVNGLMLISLVWDWNDLYQTWWYENHMTILLNKGYITGLAAIASLFLTGRLLRHEKETSVLFPRIYKPVMVVGLILVVYIVHLLELRYQVIYYLDSISVQTVIIGTYNMAFITILLWGHNRISMMPTVRKMLPAFGIFAMGSYLFYYHNFVVYARNEYLWGEAGVSGFIFHYLLVVLLVVTMMVSLRQINQNEKLVKTIRNIHWWLYVFTFVFLVSAELDHTVVLMAYTNEYSIWTITEENNRIGYPILWGISSFVLIAIGLKKKLKVLRIVALALLLVTLLKLFLIDLADISEAGKIAAFISLGVLLLITSFMYQRLKKLLLDDSQPEEPKTP